MTFSRILTAALLVALAGTAAIATQNKITVGDDVFYLRTNTEHGECRSREVSDGSLDWLCEDGVNFAALNTEIGCTDSGGSGYCARHRPGTDGESGSQLNCDEGDDYWPHSGVMDDNNCVLQEGQKICHSADGKGYAEATCHGCMRTEGSGICCITACDLSRMSTEEDQDE